MSISSDFLSYLNIMMITATKNYEYWPRFLEVIWKCHSGPVFWDTTWDAMGWFEAAKKW